ncbi:MAG: peptidase domain-containing ABC transporter [Alphaproteobacteria bacterium]|jgi:ATP-binding cassette subfamily C protein LapB|nr:peptidase domain-containing ABC transporter [Alphaproteobacteria bacterium]
MSCDAATRLPRIAFCRPSAIAASLVINLMAVALPLVILQVYDRVLPNESAETLILLVAGLAVVLVLDAILRLSRTALASWAGMRFEHETGCLSVDTILKAPQSHIESEAAGVHLDRLTAIDRLRDFHTGPGLSVLVDLPFVAVFLVLIALIGGELVLVTCTVFLLFVISALGVGRRLRSVLERRAVIDDRRISFVVELFGGIHTVKAMAMETQMMRRYERLLQSTAEASYATIKASTASQTAGAIFSHLTMLSMVSVGSIHVLAGELSVGGLAACTLLAGRTITPMLRAMGIWTHFQNLRVARGRLQTLLQSPREGGEQVLQADRVAGRLTLEDIHFAYEDGYKPLFRGLDLEVAAGEVVAIKGGNSSGRSTLLHLTMGLIHPRRGRVLLDGQDIATYEPESLRRALAYLPQQGTLFRGTILENMTLFRPEYTDQAIDLAARLGLDGFIARLPQGFDTGIGESTGHMLPGGVRQRIAIVRALVGDPRVVLFDEANSSLDRQSDTLLTELLLDLKGKATLVLITYRPSMLRLADRVYKLKDGRAEPEAQTAPLRGPELAIAMAGSD